MCSTRNESYYKLQTLDDNNCVNSPFPRIFCCCCLLQLLLVSDFSKQTNSIVCSLLYVATGVSIILSQWSANDWAELPSIYTQVRDIAALVPDHCNKADISKELVTDFLISSIYKSHVYTTLQFINYAIALCLKKNKNVHTLIKNLSC